MKEAAMNARRVLTVLPLVSTLAVVGCSAGDTAEPSPAPASTVTVTAAPSNSASTFPAASASPGSLEMAPPTATKQVKVDRDPSTPPLVTGVRFAGHKGYDRLVIDLDGPMTGYRAGWVDKLIEDGSGDVVDLKGGAYLQVTLFPANAHDEAGRSTWKGPREIATKLPNLRHVVNNGDFEGVVSIGLVLRRKAGFRVLEQSGPSRLVVDVAH